MSARDTWRRLWVAYYQCRTEGHRWGEQDRWGDAAVERGGSHRCLRCERCGWPTDIRIEIRYDKWNNPEGETP